MPGSETTLNIDFSQHRRPTSSHSKRKQPHVLMQTVPYCVHQSFKLIAAVRVSVAAKSMLSATATCSELRASTLPSCALNKCLSRVAPAPCALLHSSGVVIFCGPRISVPRRSNRLLRTALTSGSHDVRHPLVQVLTSQAVSGSRSPMASLQVPHAALAQQQEDVKGRTAHQNEHALDSILLQADSAAQPFMASPAEQLTRARVDYSKSQRPLQVRVQAHQQTAQCVFICRLQYQCLHHPATHL